MDELLCDYKRRLSAIGQMITSCEDKDTLYRLRVKAGMIRGFITDLKRAMGDNPNENPCVEISDSDIATVEALHDLLLDEKVCTLDSDLLKKSRMLTNRMYGVLYG